MPELAPAAPGGRDGARAAGIGVKVAPGARRHREFLVEPAGGGARRSIAETLRDRGDRLLPRAEMPVGELAPELVEERREVPPLLVQCALQVSLAQRQIGSH